MTFPTSNPRLFRPTLLACAIAVLCAASAASAQQAGSLQQVVVRGDAERTFSSRDVQVGAFRDQDPLDVPLMNNVVTREVLDAQGARYVTRLAGRPVTLQANRDNAADRNYWATAGNGLLGASLPRVGMKVDL